MHLREQHGPGHVHAVDARRVDRHALLSIPNCGRNIAAEVRLDDELGDAKTTVTGTSTRRDSSSSTIDLSSSQTVSGLAPGSTGLTMNSTSSGTESATGTSHEGAFTAKRVAGDTVKGVVIPFPSAARLLPYPTAGTIIRSMSATVTLTGQAATTSSRREVITYDGSATAKVVITQDGETQNCTLPLPFGRLTCP